MGEGVVHGQPEVGPELLHEGERVVPERGRRGEHDRPQGDALERDRGDKDLPGRLADQEGVDDHPGCVDRDPLDCPGPQCPPDVVARGQAGGVSQAVGRERLEVVLAHDEEGAGIGAGVAQKAVERGIAERLELEAAGEDAAEVAHRALHRVRPGQGVDEPVERAGGGADLVGRVDRQRAGLRVAAAPVLREDRPPEALLDRTHPVGEQPQPAADDETDQAEVHGADDEAGRDRRGKEERGEDPLGREPEEEAERWEDEPDEEPEPRHPDREVDEDLGGEARHGALPVARQSPRTMRRPATRGHGAMVRVGPVRSGRGAGRRGRDGDGVRGA